MSGHGVQTGPPRPAAIAGFLAIAAASLLLATALDRWLFLRFFLAEASWSEWNRLFRAVGYLPLWLLLGLALALVDWGRREAEARVWPLARGLTLAASPTLAGGLAELAKLLIRRERPELHNGEYHFRPWSEIPWSTSNLGMPSGHTAVAFAAFATLAFLFPRATPVWAVFAVGCAVQRLADHSHFLSDVTGGALLGVATAWAVLHLGGWLESRSGRAAGGHGSRRPEGS